MAGKVTVGLLLICGQVRERLKKMGHLQPLNIFLRQEIDRMRRVLRIVKTTLTDLKLAIDGTIIMNEVRRAAYFAPPPAGAQSIVMSVSIDLTVF